ncbi:hypothetical protein AB0F91_43700 [Amycolatopsis sp. NPDC023774]|uniref:hypothetical protein n=1 Tax=Amycolatopsis sp. NPDC023774 TaxID=3155015 RepID=UPI0033E0A929
MATQIKVLAAILAVAPSTAEIPIMMTVLAHKTARARPLLDTREPRVSLLLDQAQQQAVVMRDDAARSDLVAAHGYLLVVLRHLGDSPGPDGRARELFDV